MKKIVLFVLTALMMAGCLKTNDNEEPIVSDYYNQHSINNPYNQVLDSCEYILWNIRMAHKGNCLLCEERDSIKWEKRKKELITELVAILKK